MRIWQMYVAEGAQFLCNFTKYLRGWRDYHVDITYEYTHATDTVSTVNEVIARDAHHAVSVATMQDRDDAYGPELNWRKFTATVKKVVD